MTAFPCIAAVLYPAILLGGLLSALAARVSEGSRHQATCQWLFLLCLGLVGVTAIVELRDAPEAWLGAGTTFSAMVVGILCDFRRCRRGIS